MTFNAARTVKKAATGVKIRTKGRGMIIMADVDEAGDELEVCL
jgi:5S rRNA maturation endonuclease (ribonuclease M5)